MVEGIECLNSQLKIPPLVIRENLEVFRKLHVGVVVAGTMEKIALHIAIGSERLI